MNLKIFIAENCWGCDEAQGIAAAVQQTFPELSVEVIDLNQARADKPEIVFVTPTYLLNGRVVSLGNPRRERLYELIERELCART